MKSITAYTEEIDDLQLAAKELFDQTKGFEFQKNSLAIIYAEEETDYPAIYKELSKEWTFPVIGCTTLGIFLARGEITKIGISVIILTADDCEFSTEVAHSLDRGNFREEIKKAYDLAAERLKDKPRLIITYGARSVSHGMVGGDPIIKYIDELGEGTPIYGGDASDNYVFDQFKIYYNDKAYHHGQLITLISGNIKPFFAYSASAGKKAPFSYEITRAEENIVYRVGDRTFANALEQAGFDVSKEDVKRDYSMIPFIYIETKENGDRISVARSLSTVDSKTEAGLFLGSMPEGASLSVGVFTRENVVESVEEALNCIIEEEKKRGSKFGTILITSCSGRSLALAKDSAVEVPLFEYFQREGTGIAGMYAYGEYCPTKGDKSGKEYNMYHNYTFTIMAL